jgi:hypothetical protein
VDRKRLCANSGTYCVLCGHVVLLHTAVWDVTPCTLAGWYDVSEGQAVFILVYEDRSKRFV